VELGAWGHLFYTVSLVGSVYKVFKGLDYLKSSFNQKVYVHVYSVPSGRRQAYVPGFFPYLCSFGPIFAIFLVLQRNTLKNDEVTVVFTSACRAIFL